MLIFTTSDNASFIGCIVAFISGTIPTKFSTVFIAVPRAVAPLMIAPMGGKSDTAAPAAVSAPVVRSETASCTSGNTTSSAFLMLWFMPSNIVFCTSCNSATTCGSLMTFFKSKASCGVMVFRRMASASASFPVSVKTSITPCVPTLESCSLIPSLNAS